MGHKQVPAVSVRPVHWAALLTLVMLWGSSYLMISLALEVWAPAQITGLRVLLATIVLAVAVRAGRRRFPRDGRTWVFILLIAIVGNCLPFYLISWGQQGVESGLAGILAGSTPLVVLVLAHFTLDDEPLNIRQSLAFVLGFAGLVVLLGPDSLAAIGGDAARLARQLAVLGGACCYAIATILARLMPRRDPVVVSAGVMILAAGIMAPASYSAVAILPALTMPVVAAMLFLGLLGTGLASILYFFLVAETGARFTSYLNYLVPAWAVGLGALILGETLPLNSFLALALIVAGLMLGQGSSAVGHEKKAPA